MRTKKIIYLIAFITIVLLAAFWAASSITGYSVVFLLNDPGLQIINVELKKGETVQILKDLNFEEGIWTAYLVLGNDDWKLLKGYHRNCYRIRDKTSLNRLKSACEMEITSGDMGTVTSYVVLLKDSTPAWSAGVVIDNDGIEGFQSSSLGWVKPVKKSAVKDSLTLFEPVYAPIVIL